MKLSLIIALELPRHTQQANEDKNAHRTHLPADLAYKDPFELTH